MTILLCILLAASLAGNIWFYATNTELKNELATLKIANNTLEADIEELEDSVSAYKHDINDLRADKNYYYNYWSRNQNKVDLLDDWIVFIENDGTRYYHKYECDKFVGNDCWAHNVEYAKYIGYSPCPLCIN